MGLLMLKFTKISRIKRNLNQLRFSIYQTRWSDCADASNKVRVSYIEENMMLKPSLPGLHLATRMVTIREYHVIPQHVAVFTDMLSSWWKTHIAFSMFTNYFAQFVLDWRTTTDNRWYTAYSIKIILGIWPCIQLQTRFFIPDKYRCKQNSSFHTTCWCQTRIQYSVVRTLITGRLLDQAVFSSIASFFKWEFLLKERGANSFLYEQFLIVWKITFTIPGDLPWMMLFYYARV